jgi:peptidoglycan hydrolase CwlO-like protein
MTPFWMSLLKRAMPVVIEAGTSIYKQRSAAKQAYEAESPTVDSQNEQLHALQGAVIRVETETESLSRNQAQLMRAVTHLRWASLAALVLSTLALVIVLSRYL